MLSVEVWGWNSRDEELTSIRTCTFLPSVPLTPPSASQERDAHQDQHSPSTARTTCHASSRSSRPRIWRRRWIHHRSFTQLHQQPPTPAIDNKKKKDIPITSREVSALEHEAFDDTVESAALVVEGLPHLPHSLLSGTQRTEVLGRLRADYHFISNLSAIRSSQVGSSLSLYYNTRY